MFCQKRTTKNLGKEKLLFLVAGVGHVEDEPSVFCS